MRRIVQIGIGIHWHINFQKGDIFLGCEPLITEMRQRNYNPTPMPDFIESHIFEGVIVPRYLEGTVKFAVPKKDGRIESGFLMDGHRRRNNAFDVIEVKSLTLDNWLKKHETAGFMESIDFFYAPAWNIMEVLSEFSWKVKPKVVLLSDVDHRAPDVFQEQGYIVFKSGSPFIAIHPDYSPAKIALTIEA